MIDQVISESAEVPEEFWDQLIWIHKKMGLLHARMVRTLRTKPRETDVIRWRRYLADYQPIQTFRPSPWPLKRVVIE